MAHPILVQINVDGVDKCIEEKDAGPPAEYWTDAHDLTDADVSELTIRKWQITGSASRPDTVAVGLICGNNVNVTVTWDIGEEATQVATLEWVINNGATNLEWEWEVADGDAGSWTANVDISGMTACGGYLLLTLDNPDNSATLTLEINSFS